MQTLRAVSTTASAGLVLLAGCGLGGAWCTVKVTPQDARFPIASATFAADETYCVSRIAGGQTSSSSGTYRWTGFKLILAPEGTSSQTYSGYLRLDGKLVLAHGSGKAKVTAVLEKQKDERTPLPP